MVHYGAINLQIKLAIFAHGLAYHTAYTGRGGGGGEVKTSPQTRPWNKQYYFMEMAYFYIDVGLNVIYG